jgi:hypothetical protein
MRKLYSADSISKTDLQLVFVGATIPSISGKSAGGLLYHVLPPSSVPRHKHRPAIDAAENTSRPGGEGCGAKWVGGMETGLHRVVGGASFGWVLVDPNKQPWPRTGRRTPGTSSQLAEVVFRGCWDGLLGAFLVVPAGYPHPSGWLGHW